MTYRTITGLTEVVASRDLKTLVDVGLFEKSGENRGRYYAASPSILAIRAKTAEAKAPLPDPFAPEAPKAAP
jgi:hypothetical protein